MRNKLNIALDIIGSILVGCCAIVVIFILVVGGFAGLIDGTIQSRSFLLCMIAVFFIMRFSSYAIKCMVLDAKDLMRKNKEERG